MLVTMEKKIARNFNEKVQALIQDGKKRDKLYSALQGYQEDHNLKDVVYALKKIINEPKLVELYEIVRPLIPVKHQIEYDKMVPCYPSEKLRTVRLTRTNKEGLGFAVRGGLEHGVGVFVSHVTPDSQAYHQGLRVGDEVVRLNGFTISQAIHEEILNLVKAKQEVTLKVRNVGMLPVKDNVSDQLSWKYVDGSDPDKTLQQVLAGGRDVTEVKLYINIAPGGGMGCSICSGPPEMPGIFIQAIKQGGLAEEAGLDVGDQIIDVNGTSFHNITHPEAVVALKGTRSLNITIKKGVGISLFGLENMNIKEDDKKNLQMALKELEGSPNTSNNMKFKQHEGRRKSEGDNIKRSKEGREKKQDNLVNEAINVIEEADEPMTVRADINHPPPTQVAAVVHQIEPRGSHDKQVTFSKVASADYPALLINSYIISHSKATTTTTYNNNSSTSLVGNPVAQPVEVNTALGSQTSDSRLSPMYMTDEEKPSFRIQKPVLLHNARKSDGKRGRSSSKSTAIPEELYPEGGFNEVNFQPNRIFTNEEIAGRQIRLVNIQKDGYKDLGVLIENSMNSTSSPQGQILVAEIYEGGAIQGQGGLHAGDQIMMVNGRSLLDITLHEAQSVLKDEFHSPSELMQLVVAKAPPTDLGDEVLPRPDYDNDIPISNLDDYLDMDTDEEVPVTII